MSCKTGRSFVPFNLSGIGFDLKRNRTSFYLALIWEKEDSGFLLIRDIAASNLLNLILRRLKGLLMAITTYNWFK